VIRSLKLSLLPLVAAMFYVTTGGCQAPAPAPAVHTARFVTTAGPAFLQQWNTQLAMSNGETVRSVYRADGMVHILTSLNIDHSLKADTGELQFFNQVVTPDLTVHGGPALCYFKGHSPDDAAEAGGGNADPDRIVFATTRTLEVFTSNGNLDRSIDLGGVVTSPPVAVGSIVYVGVQEDTCRLAAVDVTKQFNPIIWEILTGDRVDGAAAREIFLGKDADGKDIYVTEIYATSEDGAVLAVAPDRSPLWPLLSGSKFMTGSAVVAAPVVDKFGVYVASTDQSLYCLDRGTGRIKWRFFAGAALEDAPQVTETTVYQYIPGQGLAAIDKTERVTVDSNKLLGEEPIHSPRWMSARAVRLLAEDDTNAYVLSKRNTILALDKQSGQVLFESQRTDLRAFASNLAEPIIYASTAAGQVLAIQPSLTPGAIGQLALGAAPIALPGLPVIPAR
jgi:putative pyrroloquinoline-quinone binding quinoprotein